VGILLLYLVALAVITLKPRAAAEGLPLRWVPFVQIWEIMRASGRSIYSSIGEVAGNIVLFVPLGWLLPMISSRVRSARLVVAIGAACSIVVELSQLLFVPGRSPATDDVILNTVGALIGVIMFLAPRAAD
jgi:glycopeptide antibiotics resistance protein